MINKVLRLDAEIRKHAPISGVNSNGVIWFLPEATPEQKAAAQSIVDNWVDPPDPKFNEMITELVFGSTYPGVQAWYDGLPARQRNFLEQQLDKQDLVNIQAFFDQVDTTAIASELRSLLTAFDMPITITVPE